MSEEDVIQVSDVFYGDFAIQAGNLIPNIVKGYGVFTRLGVGEFLWTLPDGQSQDPNTLTFEFSPKSIALGAGVAIYDKVNSTAIAHKFFTASVGGVMDFPAFSLRVSHV